MSVTFGLAKSRHFYHILLYMSMCIYFFYINNTAKGNRSTSLMLNKLLLLLLIKFQIYFMQRFSSTTSMGYEFII